MTKSVILCILVLSFLVSCFNEFSDNPVGAPVGSAGDPSPFLGNWRLASIGTYTPTNQLTLRVISQAGSLTATFITSAESNDHAVILTRTNGITLASIQFSTGHWEIYAAATNSQGDLVLSDPDPGVLTNDIKSGVVDGTVLTGGEGDYSIHLKATSSALLTYFSTRTNMFVPTMTFQRR